MKTATRLTLILAALLCIFCLCAAAEEAIHQGETPVIVYPLPDATMQL